MTETGQRKPLSEAEIGKKLFVQASGEVPDSMPHLGVRIAQLCQQQGINPQIIGESLLRDEGQLRGVQQAAINAHRHRGANVSPHAEELPNVTRVIGKAFDTAASAMHIPPDELNLFFARNRHGTDQFRYSARQQLNLLIKKHPHTSI